MRFDDRIATVMALPAAPLVEAAVLSGVAVVQDLSALPTTEGQGVDEVPPSLPPLQLDEPTFQRLLTGLAQRLSSGPARGVLSEDDYERLLDRLEDHLENLLHQKMELYVARLRPAIVAQVMEEMRHEALQMVLKGDDCGA